MNSSIPASNSNTVSTSRPRILVIDDSRLIRVAAEKILAGEYQVVLAEDGEQGWKEIERDQNLQIIFSDLTMPRLDGFALLKRLRQSGDQRLKNMPMIIMTTEADDENRRETALQLGATDFITKPFNAIDLKARAKAHVTSEEITRELKRKADQLEINAHRDALTGLNNRSYLMEKLSQDCSYALRHDDPLSLIRFDIESFNQYFVQHGKAFANEMIKRVAAVVSPYLRSEDTAARINLATFVVVRPGSDTEQSMGVASQIRDQIQATIFEIGDDSLSINLQTAIYTPHLASNFDVNDLLDEVDRLIQHSLDRAQPGQQNGDIVYQDDWTLNRQQAQEKACQLPGFDEALKMLERGEIDQVKVCLPKMLEKIKPLLEIADPDLLQQLLDSLKK